jgi:hypothetical protein
MPNRFGNAIPQSYLWRPRITVLAKILVRQIEFQVKWLMKSNDGTELTHAQIQPYPDQVFPILITRTIRPN